MKMLHTVILILLCMEMLIQSSPLDSMWAKPSEKFFKWPQWLNSNQLKWYIQLLLQSRH
jgi:hypothetical protein